LSTGAPGAVVRGDDAALLQAKEAGAVVVAVIRRGVRPGDDIDSVVSSRSPWAEEGLGKERSAVNEHIPAQPLAADPPEPPASEDSDATAAGLVDAIEERVFSEMGNPAEEAEPELADEEPGEEPPA
jgi:hypothetical protein